MTNVVTGVLIVNCSHVTDDGKLTCSFLHDEWQTHMGADLSTPNSENKMTHFTKIWITIHI